MKEASGIFRMTSQVVRMMKSALATFPFDHAEKALSKLLTKYFFPQIARIEYAQITQI